ncbi:MAG: hypothetical protein AAF251_03690 [Pseudomonadota bacterium]
MSRRLLALLAILSGLAALQAPAHAATASGASRLDQLSYDIGTLAEMANPQSAACQCRHPAKKPKRVCDDHSKKTTRPRLIGVLPPPVVVGSDFALE